MNELGGPDEEFRRRVHEVIPGGCHTYAKGDDQYPQEAPAAIIEGEGCHVRDLQGREFVEYGMGLRSVVLGHGEPRVTQAVTEAIRRGTNFNRPVPLELELAEAFADLVPSAEMVKFGKNGSDVTTAAVRLARAHTGRDLVAICSDHPFLSVDDWFIGRTPMAAGVPQSTRELTLRFPYNDPEGVEAIFQANPDRIACLVLEPATWKEPDEGFLESLRTICDEHGALLVFDEMITGYRWALGGAQVAYEVEPDLSTFGKAMGNGFSVAALAGRREIMERGGLRHDDERVFLLSTTHGAETTGLAAARKVLELYRQEHVIARLYRQGERLRRGVEAVARRLGVEDHFRLSGRASNLIYATLDPEGRPSQEHRTLFLQELLRRGVLAPSFVVSTSHDDGVVDRTIQAVEGALEVYKQALSQGVDRFLQGRPVQPVFRPYN